MIDQMNEAERRSEAAKKRSWEKKTPDEIFGPESGFERIDSDPDCITFIKKKRKDDFKKYIITKKRSYDTTPMPSAPPGKYVIKRIIRTPNGTAYPDVDDSVFGPFKTKRKAINALLLVELTNPEGVNTDPWFWNKEKKVNMRKKE